MEHLSLNELDAGLPDIAAAPADSGMLAMLVLRPDVDERETPNTAEFQPNVGLVGDNYAARGSSRTEDGSAHPEAEVTIMNTRVLELLTGGDRTRWPLAGDQILVDLDLSFENLPTGTRLRVGGAELEITAKPHTGCGKFAKRFGTDAAKWVNHHPERRLRGVNARVVTAGSCSVGDTLTKVD